MSNQERYNQLLALPEWRVFSWRCKQEAGFKCAFCEVKGEEKLETHHWWYVPGRYPWEVEPRQVCVMCGVCHESLHQSLATLKAYALAQCGETPEVRMFLRLFRRLMFRGFTPESFGQAVGRMVVGGGEDGPLTAKVAKTLANIKGISLDGNCLVGPRSANGACDWNLEKTAP